LKEVYAYPVALTLLLLVACRGRRARWLGVAAASIGLVLSHPLTTLYTLAYLSALLYVGIVDALRNNAGEEPGSYLDITPAIIVLGAAYAVSTLWAGVPETLTRADITVLAAYALILHAPYLALNGSKLGGLIATLALGILVFGLGPYLYSSIPGNVAMSPLILLYATPLLFLATSPRRGWKGEPATLSAAPAVLPVATGLLYLLTYAGSAVSIAHRFLNYLVYPVGLGVAKAAKAKPLATGLIALAFLASSAMLVYGASTGGDPYTFYWRYTVMDLELKSFVEAHSSSRLLGSAKYWYMLGEEHASIDLGLVAALADEGLGRRLLVFSTEELRYGFPVSPLHYVKPCFSMQAIRGLVYSNSYSFIGVL